MLKKSIIIGMMCVSVVGFSQTQCKGTTKNNVQCSNITKKENSLCHNHDKVYEIMKSKLTTLPCWTKYKSYTATNNIPMLCRDKELVQLY